MKKIIVGVLLFVSSLGFSQIKVMETVPLIQVGRIGENGNSNIYIQKEGNEYKVIYKNIDPEELGSTRFFSFKDLNNDFESFYKLTLNGYNASPVQDIKLDMPNEIVWLHYVKSLQNKVTMQFMTTNKVTGITGTSDFMTPESIKNLFGK
jgi:hypothetical protein